MRSLRTVQTALVLFGLTIASPGLCAEAPTGGQLSADVVPQRYRIDLVMRPDQPRFTGHVEIDVVIGKPTTALYLNGRDLAVHAAMIRSNGKTTPLHYTQVDPLGVARLDSAVPLAAGNATLIFDYDAAFNDSSSGVFRVKVDGTWYAWSHFEPIDARSAYPGFDQPGFKTPFDIAISTAADSAAVSNAPETSTVKTGDLVRHQFATTLPLPTYLTAFYAGPFVIQSGAVPPTAERKTPLPLRVVGTKPNRDRTDFAMQNSINIVGRLEDYFGQAFPFPKLDQVGSPIIPGAMENAGADVYGDQFLLLGKDPPTSQMQYFGEVVAHELSHQWFGDLVTPAWWDDLWLNESFANWMGYRIGNDWRPDLKIGVGAIAEALAAMDIDSLKSGRPIHQHITDSRDIASAFDSVTYGKGGQVVAMIAAYMGDQAFRDGVRLHLKRHAYGTATSEDFFRSLADAAGDPAIVTALKSFVDQQGVPLVTVSRRGNGLEVTQAPYAMLGSTPAPRLWTIPFCYTVGGARHCVLLDRQATMLPSPGDGEIMPNAGGTGYYRFAMPGEDWTRLIARSATLPPGEALAAVDSLWAQFRAGTVGFDQVLAMTRAMVANPYSDAALGGGQRLKTLRRNGLIAAGSIDAYRRFMIATYRPVLDRVGFDLAAGAFASDDGDRRELRAGAVALLSSEGGDADLRARLDHAVTQYLAGTPSALDPLYFATAFAAHVARGGVPAAQALLEAALKSEDPTFRGAAIRIVGGSGREDVAQWLAGRLDDARLRPIERISLVIEFQLEPATRAFGHDLTLRRFDQLEQGTGPMGEAVLSLADLWCSVDEVPAIAASLAPGMTRDHLGMLPLDRAVESGVACGRLKIAKGADIAESLQRSVSR